MRKTKAHYVTVRVEFGEAISRDFAVKSFRDCVYGEFYPCLADAHTTMTIRGVKSAKQHKARQRFPDSRVPLYNEGD